MYRRIIFSITMICLALLPNMLVNAEKENKNVTRAEMADAAMETYEYITQEFSLPISERPAFSDTDGSPFAYRILQAHVKEFMNGVGDEKFLPDEKVPKCQVAAVLYRVMQKLNEKYGSMREEKQIFVTDIETVPDWGTEAINYMVSADLMPLKEGKFYPYDLVTKDELDEVAGKIKKIFVPSDDTDRIDFQMFLERINKKK